jgi:hypothetical protein
MKPPNFPTFLQSTSPTRKSLPSKELAQARKISGRKNERAFLFTQKIG